MTTEKLRDGDRLFGYVGEIVSGKGFNVEEIEVNNPSPVERHRTIEQVVIVDPGHSIDVWTEDGIVVVLGGDMHYIPANTWHGIRPSDGVYADFICINVPKWSDDDSERHPEQPEGWLEGDDL